MMDGGLQWSGQDPSVTQEIYKMIDMKDNIKGGGPSLPGNHSLKLRAKKDKARTHERGILTISFFQKCKNPFLLL